MSSLEKFDAIVIGGGQAGPFLAARFAKAGMTVAMIERNFFGGTCVNTGCMPTKTLVASARAAHVARRAEDFGVRLSGPVSIDMAKVKARATTVIANARKGLEEWLAGLTTCTVIHGHGRLTGPRTVVIGDRTLTAERIFIDVGGRATRPDIPGIDTVQTLDNVGMLELDIVPKHLVVVGGSYIGLELAQMYRRFGSEVTVVEMGPRLVSREDPDVSSAIEDIMTTEGIKARTNAKCIKLTPCASSIAVGIDCASGAPEAIGTHVLVAVGRTPNTSDLGLEAAGVAVDARGYITVDDELRTNVPGIWAMGDCNGRGAFTHTSYNDFEIVAANVIDGDHRRVSDRLPIYGLYIDPPLGRVGMSETEVRKSGKRALVGTRPMSRVGRAVERDETRGFIKILVDADTKRILGASILGIEGDEVIHCIAQNMYAKATYTTLQRAVHAHPTVSELIPTVLGDLTPLV